MKQRKTVTAKGNIFSLLINKNVFIGEIFVFNVFNYFTRQKKKIEIWNFQTLLEKMYKII